MSEIENFINPGVNSTLLLLITQIQQMEIKV